MLRLAEVPDVIFHFCLFLDPQDIESLLFVCKFFNDTLTKNKNANPLWRAKFYRHFPENVEQFQDVQPDSWHRAFVHEYKNRYGQMSLRKKWLVRWVKEGNIAALRDGAEVIVKNEKLEIEKVKIDPLTFDELRSIELGDEILIEIIIRQKNQALVDYAYSLVLQSHRNKLDADINVALTNNKLRLIHFACMLNQSQDTILALKKSGADIEAKTTENFKPLHVAAENGHVLVVKQLLELGTNINAVGMNDSTALHCAAQNAHLPVIELLLNNNADVNVATSDGDTALILTSAYGHFPIVLALLAKKPSVNAANNSQATALCYAAQIGNLPIVIALLEAGATIDAVPNMMNTPLLIAASLGHTLVVEALLAHKANANHIGYKNETALEKTLRYKHYDSALMLYAKEVTQREDNHHLYSFTFFDKTIEFGKPAKDKKAAVQALIAVKENRANIETLIPHLPALTNGRLGKIFKGLGYQKLLEAKMKAKHSY